MAQRRSLTPPPYHSSPLLSLHSTCLQPQPSPEPRSLSPKINSTIFKNPKFNNFVLQSGPDQTPLRLPSCCPCLSSQPQSLFFARNRSHCSGTGSCQDIFSLHPPSPAPTLCCHPYIQTTFAAPGSLLPALYHLQAGRTLLLEEQSSDT